MHTEEQWLIRARRKQVERRIKLTKWWYVLVPRDGPSYDLVTYSVGYLQADQYRGMVDLLTQKSHRTVRYKARVLIVLLRAQVVWQNQRRFERDYRGI